MAVVAEPTVHGEVVEGARRELPPKTIEVVSATARISWLGSSLKSELRQRGAVA